MDRFTAEDIADKVIGLFNGLGRYNYPHDDKDVYYNKDDKEQMIEDISCAFESLDDFRQQIITTLTCDSDED